ncbi:MAG TPA: hypothetical protein DEB06_03295, partial [Phycisphaerales bacterium]|nr:hypothetical protein [Phycisphaerales bacterium]
MAVALRVLHLVEPAGAEWTTLGALRGLAEGSGPVRHEVVALGGSECDERCRAAGLSARARVVTVNGRAAPAWIALRRVLRRLGPFDAVHAWSAGALVAGSLANEAAPLLATLSEAPP